MCGVINGNNLNYNEERYENAGRLKLRGNEYTETYSNYIYLAVKRYNAR